MRNCTVVSSLTSEKWMTQAGLVYLCTALARAQYNFQIIDLSGRIVYFDPPEELHLRCDSPYWMNPHSISYGDWMDRYLPSAEQAGDFVFFSSLFSPDIVFHARYSHNIKTSNPEAVTAIGGAALAGLRQEQLEFLASFFDYVLIGHDVDMLLRGVFNNKSRSQKQGVIVRAIDPPGFRPDYSLVHLEDFVTVYTGHGCYYGKCRFCDYPARAYQKIVFRNCVDVAGDAYKVYQLQPSVSDIVLTQDSYTAKHLAGTAHEIGRYGGYIPYNLMLRAEPWVTQEIGEILGKSGCTDVFIGAEALNDEILQVLNKGVTTREILNSVKALSEYVDVTIGIILFVPGVSENALNSQLKYIEELLPYLCRIEPEVLTVVNGSGFAHNPSRHGIILDATENLLNDSWCFGLSPDIPWTMTDTDLMEKWFEHTHELRGLCSEYVKAEYWRTIKCLQTEYYS